MSSIYIKGLNALRTELTHLTNKIAKTDLNRQRAFAFSKYAAQQIATDSLQLRQISEATSFMRGGHPPIADTGELLRNIKVKSTSNTINKKVTEAGYFTDSKKHSKREEELGAKVSDPLRLNQIATLHHTGYRIPLQGEKGRKVRGFLVKTYGIVFSKSRSFIQVPPRPFLYKAAEMFASSGADDKILNNYMIALLQSKGYN